MLEKSKNKKLRILNQTDMINDFIFACFFLGNDFLPHLPSVDINKGGLDIIIQAYIEIYTNVQKKLLTVSSNDVFFDDKFLRLFLQFLSKREDYYFKEILPKYKNSSRKRRCPFSDPYEKEMWELENMKSFKIVDPIKLGKGSSKLWKYRYYSHYFKVEGSTDELVDDICRSFFEGLKWVGKYYFHGCPSWRWQYEFTHAPFISDLYRYVSHGKLNKQNIRFDQSAPLAPCQQLLAVLPSSCYKLLPFSYRKLVLEDESSIIDLFPLKVELDMINKDLYWKCVPFIPIVDSSRIEEATKELKLTINEQFRNKILIPYEN
jgi:5'-3' exonuclease